MNVALVYDRINKFGGAERVLLELHKLWPNAPLYTAVYSRGDAPWASVFTIHESFLGRFPWARKHNELYPWLTQLAFESFDFSEYDVVISVTSAEAKAVITPPEVLHICYCLTPTRYLWSGYETYRSSPGFGRVDGIVSSVLKKMHPILSSWDIVASSRPDIYVAISDCVKQRIEQYYLQTVSAVIYPPVDTKIFEPKQPHDSSEYLLVSRLVGHKRVDIVIDAFNELKLPLIIIGDGKQKRQLQKRAGDTISFVDHSLTDKQLATYYQNSKALVFAGEEDFGIVSLEAQACGTPVIAYNACGYSETVRDGVTGILYNDQTKQSLMEAIEKFQHMTFDIMKLRKHAQRFSSETFLSTMSRFVDTSYRQFSRHI